MVLMPFDRHSHSQPSPSNAANEPKADGPRSLHHVPVRDDLGVVTRRVLVVDDDPDLRMLLKFALDREGVSKVVGEAGNGREAIEAAREHQPDTIVLDHGMPVMTGLEAIPSLREVAPSARIVMYTAYAHTEQRAEFEKAADAVLVKGGPMGELLELV